jgi:hypothetical protein
VLPPFSYQTESNLNLRHDGSAVKDMKVWDIFVLNFRPSASLRTGVCGQILFSASVSFLLRWAVHGENYLSYTLAMSGLPLCQSVALWNAAAAFKTV